MRAITDVIVAVAATGMIVALLTVFFDWRERWLSHIRGESHEH